MRVPLLVWLLVALLIFLAAGGLYGGAAMLMDPSGALLQMEGLLPRLFVPDYTLPGLLLLLVMGLAPLLLGYALLRQPYWAWAEALPRIRRQYWAWSATIALGMLLVLWLAVQAALIGFRWPIQYATAVTGALVVILTMTPTVRHTFRRASRRHRHRAHGRDDRIGR